MNLIYQKRGTHDQSVGRVCVSGRNRGAALRVSFLDLDFSRNYSTGYFKERTGMNDERKTILRCVVGSTLHGLGISGQDDRDEMGICLEHPNSVIGLKKFEQYTYRTKPEGVRSGPGDLDVVIYSLRKWVRLALGGNPTVILPLYAPKEYILEVTKEGQQLRQLYKYFLSESCLLAFQGYLRSQRLRLIGKKAKNVSRPELVEAHGFDTKYAMHMLRLGYQGVQLCEEGKLILPMQDPQRKFLRSVRTGEVSLRTCLAVCDILEDKLIWHLRAKTLPLRPDTRRIEEFLMDTYLTYWGKSPSDH